MALHDWMDLVFCSRTKVSDDLEDLPFKPEEIPDYAIKKKMAKDVDKIIPPDSVPVDYDINTSLPMTNLNNISKKAQTAALGRAPDVALGQAPDAALGSAPDAALGSAPDAALGRASDAALGRAPDSALGQAPDAVRDQASDAALGRALDAEFGRAALGRAPDAAVNRVPGGDLLSQSQSLQDLRRTIPNVSNIVTNDHDISTFISVFHAMDWTLSTNYDDTSLLITSNLTSWGVFVRFDLMIRKSQIPIPIALSFFMQNVC